MNYKVILFTLGKILKLCAALMFLPLIVSFVYKDNNYSSFLIPIVIMLSLGVLLTIKSPKKKEFYAKEGFVICGLSWIIISFFGSLPFLISGEIPNFIDAYFETVSGFTTTGASILTDVEVMSHSMLFWRSFTHWIGGMGVLVLMLAIMPSDDNGRSIFILKAESPGPQVGKFVSKLRFNARILYIIYVVITIVEIIMLLCGGMPLFDSIVHSFGTAGTGGFGIKGDSIGGYNEYCQVVIGIFMLIFGINFNLFYLLLIGNIKQAIRSEEVWWYLIIVIISTIIITCNVFFFYDGFTSIGESIRHAFFQVTSIMTTTGYATYDFNVWPSLSKMVLLTLMFIGACAGSTGGGLKVSRIIIMIKSAKREIYGMIHPNSVKKIKFEGSILDEKVIKGTSSYLLVFFIIFAVFLLLISFDNLTFETNFSALTACINNIGPGFDLVGPASNYAVYSGFSKVILTLSMLIGRLEIYPILVLVSVKTWLNK